MLKGRNLHFFIKAIRMHTEVSNQSPYLLAELYGYVNGMYFANLITTSSMNRLKRYIKKSFCGGVKC